jgi:hypothetical protein
MLCRGAGVAPPMVRGLHREPPMTSTRRSWSPRSRSCLAASLALACLGACADAEGPAPPDPLATGEARGAFENNKLWHKDTLVVCWKDDVMADPQAAEGRVVAQRAVEGTWDDASMIDIVGADHQYHSLWKACSETPVADIKIGRSFAGFGSSEFGTASLAADPSMYLDVVCEPGEYTCPPSANALCNLHPVDDPPPSAGDPDATDGTVVPLSAGQKKCVQSLAVHEFGHALGLRHEQARPDRGTCSVVNEDLNTDGLDGRPLWAYDPDSVMNYCREPEIEPKLSSGDILAINTLYPSQVKGFAGPDLTLGATPAFGPGVYTEAVDHTTGIASLSIPPGYWVVACLPDGACVTLLPGKRTLPVAYRRHVTRLEVRSGVAAYASPGFVGASQGLPIGVTQGGGLATVGNNAISSVAIPPGYRVRLCDQFASGNVGVEPCVTLSSHVAQPEDQLSPLIDNKASFAQVTPLVVVYESTEFRGVASQLQVGTYSASESRVWNGLYPKIRSLLIPYGVHVKACTNVDGVHGCTILTSSTFSTNGQRYPYFEVVGELLPPPIDPTL